MNDTPKGRPRYGPGSNFHGKKGRSGAPARHYMKGGKLPTKLKYIEGRCNQLRRDCEQAVLDAKGEITLQDAAAINSILKWERHGCLAAHWLRTEMDKLSAADRLRFSEAIAKASDNRDRCIRALALDVDRSQTLLDALYRAPLLPANGTSQGDDLEDK